MPVLLIAEHDNQIIKPSTLALVSAARELDACVDVLVIGNQCNPVLEQLKTIAEISTIIVLDHADYLQPVAEYWVPVIASFSSDYTHIIMPANTLGKNILPRVAGLLNTEQISDVITILDANTYRRPIYAGNIIATVRHQAACQLLTIRTTAFPAITYKNAVNTTIQVKTIEPPTNANTIPVQWIEHQQATGERPELATATRVVAGGRGICDQAQFAQLIAIADRLGAAIGASRAAVDAGLAPNAYQVGQTGQMVAPELYLAVGISGAIQHMAGIKDSKIIVAINKDPDAPIFQIADYGLVADINEILPVLETALTELGY